MDPASEPKLDAPAPAAARCERAGGDDLRIELSGAWRLTGPVPSIAEIEGALQGTPAVRRVRLAAERLGDWDTSLLIFLEKLRGICAAANVELLGEGLPAGARRLLALAAAVPERQGARRGGTPASLVDRVGTVTLESWTVTVGAVRFLGETVLAALGLLRGRSRFRAGELLALLEECGLRALPIVSLISFLVGLILAFVGAVQLRMFGAQIYIANLVGLGMARDMAAMMTGIIMAGRTGAAYAAKLGTMQVNEEIDALRTLGIGPVDTLVLPRVLALSLMMPLLCVYADIMGMLGGAVVCVGLFEISASQYYHQTIAAVPLVHFGVGIVKSVVYGAIIALSGCLRGMQCGRSAAAVGDATTSAVVTAIVWIVVACAGLTVLCNILDI
jgi:phospholipid/cholesterol/gamma-HCH transport system permease protein